MTNNININKAITNHIIILDCIKLYICLVSNEYVDINDIDLLLITLIILIILITIMNV